MVTRAQICAEAASWAGTPNIWQAAVKGRGADCRGIIYGVARNLGLPEAQDPWLARPVYRTSFAADDLLAGLEKYLIRVDTPEPGDVIAIRIRPEDAGPRHLAILLEDGKIIHSYGRGVGRAVIVPLGKSRPVHSYWTWPSLRGGHGH